MTIFTGFSPFVVTSFSKYLKSYRYIPPQETFLVVNVSIKPEERKTLQSLHYTSLIYIHIQPFAIYQTVHTAQSILLMSDSL